MAWEAPLDGAITLGGLFERGDVQAEEIPLAGVDPKFGSAAFEALFEEVEAYKSYAYNCAAWPEKEFCHRPYSEPYQAQYTRPAEEFSFVQTFPGRMRVSLYRRDKGTVDICFDESLMDKLVSGDGGKEEKKLGSIEIGDEAYPFDDRCRPTDGAKKRISVRTGDVLYLTYSVHPHFAKWLKPRAVIRMRMLKGTRHFQCAKRRPTRVAPASSCNWNLASKVLLQEAVCLHNCLRMYLTCARALFPPHPTSC